MQSLESSQDNATNVEPSAMSFPEVEADNSASEIPQVVEADGSPLPSRIQSERIKAASICPIPVRSRPLNKRRSTLGATVLTSSPYKSSLEEKLGRTKSKKSSEENHLKPTKSAAQAGKEVKATSDSHQTWRKTKAAAGKKSTKSSESHVTRRGVLKPPKPVECFNRSKTCHSGCYH